VLSAALVALRSARSMMRRLRASRCPPVALAGFLVTIEPAQRDAEIEMRLELPGL
jgi:hypothetical protein